jgi:2-dehydropantoate 2-reductase
VALTAPGRKYMSKIAVVGPGAIGCAVGGALIEAGLEQISFCGNTSFDRVHVNYPDGPAFEGSAEVYTSPETLAAVDWILLCVKAQQVPTAAPWFKKLYGSETRVAVLQNGVEHVDSVHQILNGKPEILPVVVQIPAERTAPGVVTLGGTPHLLVPDNAVGLAFQALFKSSRLPVKTTPDFLRAMWEKLCLNAANGAITALTERDQAVLRDPDAAETARQIILETMAVGRAEGLQFDDDLPDRIVSQLAGKPGATGGGNSMFYDRLAGRELEYEARNGVVVRLGKKHGISTPVNATLFALLKNLKPRSRG